MAAEKGKFFSNKKNEAGARVVETLVVNIEDDDSIGYFQKRSVALWLWDAVLLFLDHLQLFSIILSLSLAWSWPISWIRGTSFVLLFNLDLWEFTKIHTVYQGRNHAFEDPNTVPFDYFWYAWIYLFTVVICPVLLAVVYAVIPHVPSFGPVKILILRAKFVRVFLIAAHIFSIPFGLTVVRLFDCQNYTNREMGGTNFRSIVLQDTDCWSGTHLGLLVPITLAAIAYFIVLPAWMIYKIRKELILPLVCSYRMWRTYEDQLLLKEAEYIQGLDIEWATHQYSLFSSFRRPWVWFEPFSYIMKMFILLVYGGLFYARVYQVCTLFGVFVVAFLVVLIVPVYRVRFFNFILTFSILINVGNITLGLLLVLEVQNAFLFGQNLLGFLVAINITWCLVAILCVCYLFARKFRSLHKIFGPLWPLLSELDSTSRWQSKHTEKFFRAMLKGRKILEKCYSTLVFFAPVHELSTHIQIINAYFREAEVLEDPVQHSLWALLAEMVDAHTVLAPHSVYGVSTKDSVPFIVRNLMSLMPAFKKRLDERDYDLILWTPLKRRILLKLFTIATFLKLHKKRTTLLPLVVIDQETTYHTSAESTLSFLNDSSELKNDNFLHDIEKWEHDRNQSIAAFSHDYQLASIGSLRTEGDETFHEVELWENKRETKRHVHSPRYHRPSSAGSLHTSRPSSVGQNRVRSAGSIDYRTAEDVASILASKKSSRPHSKLSVQFNLLDTISEHNLSRSGSPVSFTSTDDFIESINEQFPQTDNYTV